MEQHKKEAINSLQWLKNINMNVSNRSVGEIYQTITSLLETLNQPNGLGIVNSALALVDEKTANMHDTVAVLRVLSRKKNELSDWKPLEQRFRKELHERVERGQNNYNVDKIMVNLNREE